MTKEYFVQIIEEFGMIIVHFPEIKYVMSLSVAVSFAVLTALLTMLGYLSYKLLTRWVPREIAIVLNVLLFIIIPVCLHTSHSTIWISLVKDEVSALIVYFFMWTLLGLISVPFFWAAGTVNSIKLRGRPDVDFYVGLAVFAMIFAGVRFTQWVFF